MCKKTLHLAKIRLSFPGLPVHRTWRGIRQEGRGREKKKGEQQPNS